MDPAGPTLAEPNIYCYVSNNSINKVDPYGLMIFQSGRMECDCPDSPNLQLVNAEFAYFVGDDSCWCKCVYTQTETCGTCHNDRRNESRHRQVIKAQNAEAYVFTTTESEYNCDGRKG